MSIVLNITCVLDQLIVDDWLNFTKESINQEGNTTGYTNFKVFRIIPTTVQPPSYCMQYSFNSLTDLDKFQKENLPELESSLSDKYGEKCLIFTTVLQAIS